MEQWALYPGEVEGERAWFLVDLAYRGTAADDLPPRCGRIEIAMLDTGSTGLGSVEEFDAVNQAEGVALANVSEVRNIARIRLPGRWQYVFYGPAGYDFDALAARFRDAAGGRAVRASANHDPLRLGYLGVLPNRRQEQWLSDLLVCEGLRESGDDGTTPRRVDHWCYFPNQEAMDRFAGRAQAVGFAVESRSYADGRTLPHGLQFHREDRADLDSINLVTLGIVEAVAEPAVGGEYDGWETEVVTTGRK